MASAEPPADDEDGGLSIGDVRDLFPDGFLSDPTGWVLGIVATWIVGGVITFWQQLLAYVLIGAEVVAEVPTIVGGSLGAAFGDAGGAVLATLTDVNATIVASASSAGPFGWVLLSVGYVAIVFGVLYGLGWLVRAIDVPIINLGPILSGLFSPFRFIWRVLT